MESLWVAKTGLEAQQTRMSVISQQSRQRQHHRLQARPRDLRGPAVPERRASRRSDVAADRGADRPEPRHGRAGSGDATSSTRRATDHNEQPVRRRRSRPRLLRGPAARRHAGLYAGRNVPAQRARRSSSRRAAIRCSRRSTIPTGAQSVTIGADGVVSAVLPGQSAPIQVGTLAAHRLRQSRGSAAARRESVHAERRQRAAASRHARPERPRPLAQGVPRDVERQCGRGARER